MPSKNFTQLLYAFANATADPKIPDGACSLSLGQPYSISDKINLLGSNDGTIHILLSPGLHHTLHMYMEKAGATPADQNEFHIPLNTPAYTTTVGATMNNAANATDISKWRIVSTGLKLLLINGADNVEGWWEAIRFNPEHNPNFFRWATQNAATGDWITNNANQGYLIPNFVRDVAVAGIQPLDHVFGITRNATLADNRTYSLGRLRDIDDYTFQLQPFEPSHNFVPVFIGGGIPLKNDARDMLYDPSEDWIYIRIHGQNGNGNVGGNTPTKLVYHLVSNQEWIVAPTDDMAPHMTESRVNNQDMSLLRQHLNTRHIPAAIGNNLVIGANASGGLPTSPPYTTPNKRTRPTPTIT